MSNEETDALALARREGLPDDLLWLLKKYPRGSWNASLGEVGKFWLGRHAMFREAHGLVLEETGLLIAGEREPHAFAPRFARLAGFLLHELEGHHQIEDIHYFPRLARLEPSLQRGFDLLDADHDALHEVLEDTGNSANALLRAVQSGAPGDAPQHAAEALNRLGRLLDRHLADEEDIVAPVLLEHGEVGLG